MWLQRLDPVQCGLSMLDNPTEKAIINPFEDGEDLCCDLPHTHPTDPTNLAQPETLTVEKAQRMSEFLGFLADTNRLRILSLLTEQELCVGDLAIALEMNESAVSHQLRTLRAIRLVSFRKQGRHVFYRLQDHHVLDFYQAIFEHLDEAT
jgi:ArsR family transcriptional regulator, lead/cadmium/zinc/bismuth-responsive transcriptional repressor